MLTKRFPGPVRFPLDFSLTSETDLTPEGLASLEQWANSKTLVLSARLDTDGVAATRDATDLVGKATAELRTDATGHGVASHTVDRSSKYLNTKINLVDRGIGGKLVTRKAQLKHS